MCKDSIKQKKCKRKTNFSLAFLIENCFYNYLLLYDWIKFDELTLMVLSVINQFGSFLTYCLDIVETRQSHVAIQVGGGRTWMY